MQCIFVFPSFVLGNGAIPFIQSTNQPLIHSSNQECTHTYAHTRKVESNRLLLVLALLAWWGRLCLYRLLLLLANNLGLGLISLGGFLVLLSLLRHVESFFLVLLPSFLLLCSCWILYSLCDNLQN